MTPRFEVRFNNGVYHVFDTHTYRAARARDNRKQAEADVKYLNARPAGARK